MTDVEYNLRQAIQAIKAGDKAIGRELLTQVVKVEPKNELAWLWLASVVTDPYQKKEYLQTVLRHNPNNKVAQEGLAQLETLLGAKSSAHDPFDLPQVEDIMGQKTVQPPPSSGGISKALADSLHGSHGRVNSYRGQHPARVIIAYGAAKGRKFQRGEAVSYQGLGWAFSRWGTLILSDRELVCGDWQIPLTEVKQAFVTPYPGIFDKGLILEVTTHRGETYAFGLVHDTAWLNQTVLPLEIKPARNDIRAGCVMVILGPIIGIAVGYVFGYLAAILLPGRGEISGNLFYPALQSLFGMMHGLYIGMLVGTINTRLFGTVSGAIIGIIVGVIVAIIFSNILGSVFIGSIVGILAGILLGAAWVATK